jgi:DNA polymerase III delta prime subunit
MFQTSNKNAIINYDEKDTVLKVKHRTDAMPSNPGIFNCLMVGPSASGKSNLLLNLIYDHLTYDKLYVYANNIHQPVYQKLKQHLDNICSENDIEPNDLYHFSDKLEDVILINDLDDKTIKLVIFDDFMMSTEKEQSIILEYYIRGRHKRCINIYLAQSYSKVPITIRRNCRVFFIWTLTRGRDLKIIYDDMAQEMSYNMFKLIFMEATKIPYNFLYVDKNGIPSKKYRRNLSDYLINFNETN